MNARRPTSRGRQGIASTPQAAVKPPSKPTKTTRAPSSRPPTRETAKTRPESGRIESAHIDIRDVEPQDVQAPESGSQPVAVTSKPETLTWRMLMIAVVGLLTVGLLAPTLRGALDQYQQYSALERAYQEALTESERLDGELARWEDPAFIESQARTRLSYTSKGDKVWRPIGTDILAEDIDPATGLRVKQGIVGARRNQPWFSALLESIRVANGPVESKEAPDDLTALLNTDD